MATKAKKAPTVPKTRAPSSAELARAVELMEAAKRAEQRQKLKSWTSEAWLTNAWALLVRPPRGGLRDLYRHVLVPWYWGAGVAAAILVQEAVLAAADVAGLASLVVVAAGAAACARGALAWMATTKAARRHGHAAAWVAREPGHARVVAYLAAGAAIATHVAGLALGWTPQTVSVAAAAFLSAFAAVGARYWQWHRHNTTVRNPDAAKRGADAPTSTQEADPAEVVRRLRERWPPHVAAPNKALPGSQLSDITQTSFGATATLELAPGSHEKTTVTSALGKIASGLRLSPEALAVEDIAPAPGQEPDSSILRLRVISQATSARPVALDDGHSRVITAGSDVLIRLGNYIDGQGEATWKLYDKDSMWGGFFAGKTGAGKTTFIETLVMGALQTGCTLVIYAKPRKGPSPRIAKHAHWTIEADPADRSTLVDGLVRMMEVRGLVNEANDTSEFHPSPDWPGVLIVADEFHEFAAQVEKAGAGRLNRLSREGRAVGVVLVGASQGFGLDGFVQDDIVRSSMTTTNAISAKLAATQAGIFSREMGLSVNPGNLPDPQARDRNKGLAYSLGGREVAFRGAWAPEAESDTLMAAARTRAVAGPDAVSASALDAGSRGAYSQREARKQRRKQQVQQMLADLGAHGGAATAGDAGALARADAATGGRPVPPELPERVVIDLAAHRQHTQRAGRAPAEAGVIEALQSHGPLGTSAIRETLTGRDGCGKDAIDKALRTLADSEVITKANPSRKSPWRLT